MKSKKPIVLDLFSGCGGLSYGLEQAGFSVALGIDNWGVSLETFAHNHLDAKALEADISKVSADDIKKLIGSNKIDVIVGGPPCQGFSLSGPRNFHDSRNRLYLDFIRLVKELKPRAFIVENVPGLGSLFKGEVKLRIIEEFEKLGYTVNAKVLNASDYGVPQNRKRIIFVGLLGDKKFEFPDPTHFESKDVEPIIGKRKVTVAEAIGDLPALVNEATSIELSYEGLPKNSYQKSMRKGSKTIYNHVKSKHTQQTKDIISLVPEGGNYKNLPENLKRTRNFHVAWTRLHSQKPSPTIDTGHRHHFHPFENRVPTVREAARIQSFPDTFVFLGTRTAQYKQVGNAVPCLMATEIGKKLIRYL